MKNPFKREVLSYQSETPTTPYQKAQQEWDSRMGSVVVQARNWRLCAFGTLLLTVMLTIILVLVLATHKDRLFIAEVTKEGRVVNVAPAVIKYQPSEAQKEYFISNFVKLIKEVTLDPVAVKKNWLNAYNFLSARGAERLNAYFKENNPVSLLGKGTVVVEITDINQVSAATLHLRWTETTINNEGHTEGTVNYSGVFTMALKQPTTREEILRNPLGIYIVDFNISVAK